MEKINLNELGDIAEAFLKLCKEDLDAYTRDKGIIEKFNSPHPGAKMLTPAYVQFAKYGRGPGKNPPVENILDFVKAKSISFSGLTERQTAWVIAIKIGREGTKNFKRNAPNFIGEVIKLYEPELMENIGEFSANIVQESIRRIVPTIFPKRIRF